MDVSQTHIKTASVANRTLPSSPTKSPPNSQANSPTTYTEKFPTFAPSKIKSRSLTQMEVQAATMTLEDINDVAARLRTGDSPLSLEQARERRASVKEDRKICIEFIKRRTSSRAAALARPDLEALQHAMPKVDLEPLQEQGQK